MKAKHYVIITIGVLLLGVVVIGRTVRNSLFRGTSRAYFAKGGQASGEEIKTPLKASLNVQQRRGMITFLLRLRDATGKDIRSLRLPTGRPKPPKVAILNSQGEKVYTCTLEYG